MLHLKNILFFLLFSSLILKGSENCANISGSQNKNSASIIFQDSPPSLDSKDYNGHEGILEALQLTERHFTGSGTNKINKPGFFDSTQKRFLYSTTHYGSYYLRRINNLGSTPLYIATRRFIV